MICFSENPLLHVQSPPRGLDSKAFGYSKSGGRRQYTAQSVTGDGLSYQTLIYLRIPDMMPMRRYADGFSDLGAIGVAYVGPVYRRERTSVRMSFELARISVCPAARPDVPRARIDNCRWFPTWTSRSGAAFSRTQRVRRSQWFGANILRGCYALRWSRCP